MQGIFVGPGRQLRPMLSTHVQRLRATRRLGRLSEGDAAAGARHSDRAVRGRPASGRRHPSQRDRPGDAGRGQRRRARADDLRLPAEEPRGSPVFNFKSESRRFDKSNRCLVPASAFFEFTGKRYPKAKHRFALKDAPFMAIAGLWRETEVTDRRPSPCSRRHRARTWRLTMTGRSQCCGRKTGPPGST